MSRTERTTETRQGYKPHSCLGSPHCFTPANTSQASSDPRLPPSGSINPYKSLKTDHLIIQLVKAKKIPSIKTRKGKQY